MTNVQDEIIKAIDLIVQKALETYRDNDVIGMVTKVNGAMCTVSINGANYTVKNGIGVALAAGDSVWLRIPNNNYNNMYIASKR